MIDPGHPRLSIVRQCELVSISRASFYRRPAGESPENLALMRLIDETFLECPFYGARQMARHLRRVGWCVGRKRVRRLMRKIGLSPIYQAPKTSEPHPQHKIYPYLLRHLAIERPHQVWCADMTYVPMRRGFLYLVAIMDWFSRRAIANDVSPEPHPAMDRVRASFEPVWLGGATQSLAYSPGVRLPRRLCGRIVL